ncbi:murein hydrolase activator EnvC family protein [Futiania mangrovi]|uniref:Peptidoglycan DD-metalloendopeptidase family protein n=1 Tax=Futiania mangrovi TaxID=2959716 RepID=A0A9J6PDJ1_9PROT|nr:peptidoglycan DD-metalloendopeptidase family protein [Futiania mangrovii]MCP1336705.1 peptidoglycan DD-metalloendopeptidase family protein [Futiania mangrovii]
MAALGPLAWPADARAQSGSAAPTAEDIVEAKESVADLRSRLIDLAARVRETEERQLALDTAAANAARAEETARDRLVRQRAELGEILSAMQRLGRTPPAAALLAPGGPEEAARAAMLLKTLTVELDVRAQRLAADVRALTDTRAEAIAAAQAARRARAALEEERTALSGLVEQRQARVTAMTRAFEAAEARARIATRASRDLTDLVRKLDEPLPGQTSEPAPDAADRAPEAQGQIALAAIPRLPPQTGLEPPPARPTAAAFAARRGSLPLPAPGRIVQRFDDAGRFGQRTRGMTVAAPSGAQIIAPVDAEVAFAGPFRGYGRLVILAPAAGYHLLLAGLDRLDVREGQWLLAGEPLGALPGTTADGHKNGTISGTVSELYIELRHDGVPVDPMPWIAPDQRKVTGS